MPPPGNSIEPIWAFPRPLHHPDHLGTGTLITDLEGRPHQFFLNLPYGETFIEQGGHTYDNPYKFNGKELDPETGLYYYGARYYDPKISLWLSVDPLAEKYPGMSPYNYTAGNPVKYIDPDGRFPIAPLLWWVGKRATAGAIADVAVQLLQEWIEGGGSIGEAWERLDIDGWQVARSAGENLVKGKYTAAALSAAGDMITYMINNDDWTWEEAFFQAGYGALSSIVGDKLARTFARKFGDASIKAKQIFTGGLENRKLAEAYALATKYKGFKNANIELKQNNPIFDLFDDFGNVVDITTTNAKNLKASSFYNKLNKLSNLGSQYNTRILQIYTKKGQYSKKQLKQLEVNIKIYIMENNLNVKVRINEIR